jgi:arsenite methyltransferase
VSQTIQQTVRSKYGAVAESGLSTSHNGVRAIAEAFGYSADELASIPAAANMGLSCGNPTAFASLRPGETVVDLGCGGGLDVFLAARKVGPDGKAIGIDMTPQMIELARRNAQQADGGKPLANVEFHLATIDALPLPEHSVDCVISNCVINLAADKPAVFREIARVLKPGGRLAASDIALKQPLPDELGRDIMAYVGCIAGAILIDDYKQGLHSAGVQVVDTGADLNAYAQVENQAGCCSPAMGSNANVAPGTEGMPVLALCDEPRGDQRDGGCCAVSTEPQSDAEIHAGLAELLRRYNVNDYAASVRVYAVRP